jgi:cleavage stimulation factor subunit 3
VCAESHLSADDRHLNISSSFLLNFAYIELLEAKKDITEVHACFEKFLTVLAANLDVLESRMNSANSSFSSTGTVATQPVNNGLSSSVAPGLGVESTSSSFATQTSDEKPPKFRELAERRTEYGLVYIMYMRSARRSEGLKSSRAVFGRARRDRWTPWEVYEASGTELSHSSYASDPDFSQP